MTVITADVNIKSPKDLSVEANKMGKKTISYSQFSMFKECPKRWKLQYIDKNRRFEPSIHLIFGSAMHETIQYYLKTMYSNSIKDADELPLEDILKTKLHSLYKENVIKNNNKHFSNLIEISEFYNDGVAIIDYFKRKRGAYFSKKNCELIGIEMPLLVDIDSHNKIMISGFLDIIIKVNNKIQIYDFKTSAWGWKDEKKKENGDQLRIYKKYYAKQHNLDINNIDVAYFIIKRKIYENSEYPQRRIQVYIPPSGKVSMNKTENELNNFINRTFTSDGKYNTEYQYPAITGIDNKNCKYCPFKENFELCPKDKRVK